jgi:hypothetical protein
MEWDRVDSTPARILAAFIIVLVIAVIVAASTSATSFGAYNGAWDGTSELQTQVETTGASPSIIRKTASYTETQPNETVSIILAPEQSYDDSSQQRIRQFVRAGGTLVVAGDFGNHTNPLLRSLGTSAQLDGRVLRDERYNYKSPAMPRARNVSDHRLAANVSALTLNHGTAVRPRNATALVNSSGFAYLDTNSNGNLDSNETVRSWPVATVESVGDGRVIVVSDPSILINSMIDQPGNRQFIQNIVSGNKQVLLDYSHSASLPPLAVAVLILRDSVFLQLLVGLLGVGVLFAWMQRPLLPAVTAALRRRNRTLQPVSETELDAEELTAYLAQQYPEWDQDRLERVVSAVRDRRR